MTYHGWTKESDARYRLDDIWTVRRDGSWWYAYRGNRACLKNFAGVEGAMREAERLRAGDRLYSGGAK